MESAEVEKVSWRDCLRKPAPRTDRDCLRKPAPRTDRDFKEWGPLDAPGNII